jgi:hypothetical protein
MITRHPYKTTRRAMIKRRLTRAEAAYERSTSFHEAGHGVVAIHLRIAFTEIVIDDWPGLGGKIRYNKREYDKLWRLLQTDHTDARVIDWVERGIVMIFAGAIAERRYAPRSDWRWSMGHTGVAPKAAKWLARARNDTDLASINNWLQRLVAGPPDHNSEIYEKLGIEYPHERVLSHKTLEALHTKYSARATVLVRELWPEIKIVSAALLKRRVLTERQVRRLMNQARPPYDRVSHHVAII